MGEMRSEGGEQEGRNRINERINQVINQERKKDIIDISNRDCGKRERHLDILQFLKSWNNCLKCELAFTTRLLRIGSISSSSTERV